MYSLKDCSGQRAVGQDFLLLLLLLPPPLLSRSSISSSRHYCNFFYSPKDTFVPDVAAYISVVVLLPS